MHPLEYELHWETVWNYLMLDAAKVLQHQLCIPGDLAKLQRCAREVLDDHYRTNDFNLESGLLNSSLTLQLRSNFSEIEVLRFFAWGDYLSDVVFSRVGEFFWSSAINSLDELDHSDWLAMKFSEMRKELTVRSSQLEQELAALQFSDLDRTIGVRLNRSEEDLLTSLSLVSNYNLFARVWHSSMGQANPDELREVYSFGKALGKKWYVGETAICFPGAWETGPQRELLRLETK
jgi:hypothetical protein